MNTMTHELKLTLAAQTEPATTNGRQELDSSREVLQSVWEAAETELTRMVCAMSLSGDRVEDVLQDVYVTCWQKGPNLPAEQLRKWLFRVAANRCRLEHRKRKRWLKVWPMLAQVWPRSAGQEQADAAGQNEQKQLIQRELASMPETLRSVLVLRYFSEFNSTEIADILELPSATVRSHLRRARIMLAAKLEQAGLRDD